jgi:hypothetical protein
VPPLRGDRPPYLRLQPSEARQLTVSSTNCGESIEGPSTTVWRANYTTVEEIPTGEELLAGTFYLIILEHHMTS